MGDLLELYGFKYDLPGEAFEYPPGSVEQLIEQLAPLSSAVLDPVQRLLNKQVIYDSQHSFLLRDKARTAQLLEQLRQLPDYPSRIQLILKEYQQHVDWLIGQFQAEYDKELSKKTDPNPFKRFFSRVNRDYLLLLAQHLKDLKASRDGAGYHALTAELKILAGYAYYGPKYLERFPDPPEVPNTTSHRAATPPDNNLFMYVSGFLSDWQAAAREAYTVAYKLGYALENIYVFSYIENSAQPILLSEIMDRNAVFVGDARQVTDKRNDLKTAKGPDASRLQAEIDELLNKNKGRLRDWLFDEKINVQSKLYEKARALAAQLHYIQDNLTEEQQKRNKTRINLFGNSQGCAIIAGFLLQQNPDKSGYLLDEGLEKFVDKYALNVGAHGGAFLAEARVIAEQTGWLLPVSEFFINLYSKLLKLEPLQFAELVLKGSATRDLAISSDYTAENYRALSPERQAETAERLQKHSGLEIYNANDDVTTSVPLLPLPSTTQIRMMPHRHGVNPEGNGENSYAPLNKYLYRHFQGDLPFLPSLESDQLIYCGYIKKGLADMEVPLDSIPLANFLKSLDPKLVSEQAKAGILPFISGQTGILDYDVCETVYQALKQTYKRRKPAFWPSPRFNPFKP